jgi:hypothetical protein
MNDRSVAERVGFEPTLPQNGKPDFESGAFDHSATFPAADADFDPRVDRRGRPDLTANAAKPLIITNAIPAFVAPRATLRDLI